MNDYLESIKKRDPAAKSIISIILTYPGVKAVFFHQISNFFYIAVFDLIARIISQTINIADIRTEVVENLGILLNIDTSKINIKGKTTDNIGMIGSKEASACQTIISLSHA